MVTVEYGKKEHTCEEQQEIMYRAPAGHVRKVWDSLFSTNDGYQPLAIPIA